MIELILAVIGGSCLVAVFVIGLWPGKNTHPFDRGPCHFYNCGHPVYYHTLVGDKCAAVGCKCGGYFS